MLQPNPVCRISVNGGQKQQRKALQGAPDFENGFIIGQQLRNQRKIQNNKQRQRPVLAAATGIKPAKSAGQQSQRQPYQQSVQTCSRFCRTILAKNVFENIAAEEIGAKNIYDDDKQRPPAKGFRQRPEGNAPGRENPIKRGGRTKSE